MNNAHSSDTILGHDLFKIKTMYQLFDLEQITSFVIHFKNDFLNRGLRVGDYAAVLSENNIEYLICILSLWQIGAIPVLINTRLTRSEIEDQISFCKIVFLSRIQKAIFTEFRIPSTELKISEVKSYSSRILIPVSIKPAVIIYTSGSTSKPKAVELSFNSLYQSFLTGNKILNQYENDKWLASLPFYHIGGFSIFTRAFFGGCTLIIPENLSAESIQKNIGEEKPTILSLVSPQLKRLVDKKFSPNSELRIALLGGGMIDNELISSAINLGWNIYKVYGSTETASFISILSPQDFHRKSNSSGKLIHPNQIFILDENGSTLPPNTTGEIKISGNSLFSRYLFDEEATSLKLSNEYYYSGDIGFIDSDGYLFIEARRTDLIISGGENINPLEIESAIRKFPNVEDVCVFPLVDKEWGQQVAAAIITQNELEFNFEELGKNLKGILAGFKIPKQYFFCKELPKNSLGKVLRNKVVEMFDEKNN